MDSETCDQVPYPLGPAIQLSIFWTCASILLVKQVSHETKDRRWRDFACDSSKQLLGAAVLQLLSGPPKSCGAYWASTILDSTLGVLLEYLLLGILVQIFHQGSGGAKGFQTGNYENKQGRFTLSIYLVQLLMWVIVVAVTKVFVALLQSSYQADWAAEEVLQIFGGVARINVLVVGLVTPCVMHALQVWITDDFLKKDGAQALVATVLQKGYLSVPNLRQMTLRRRRKPEQQATGLAEPLLKVEEEVGGESGTSTDLHVASREVVLNLGPATTAVQQKPAAVEEESDAVAEPNATAQPSNAVAKESNLAVAASTVKSDTLSERQSSEVVKGASAAAPAQTRSTALILPLEGVANGREEVEGETTPLAAAVMGRHRLSGSPQAATAAALAQHEVLGVKGSPIPEAQREEYRRDRSRSPSSGRSPATSPAIISHKAAQGWEQHEHDEPQSSIPSAQREQYRRERMQHLAQKAGGHGGSAAAAAAAASSHSQGLEEPHLAEDMFGGSGRCTAEAESEADVVMMSGASLVEGQPPLLDTVVEEVERGQSLCSHDFPELSEEELTMFKAARAKDQGQDVE